MRVSLFVFSLASAVLFLACKPESKGNIQGIVGGVPPQDYPAVPINKPYYVFHWTNRNEFLVPGKAADTIWTVLTQGCEKNAALPATGPLPARAVWGCGLYVSGDPLQSYEPMKYGENLVLFKLKPGPQPNIRIVYTPAAESTEANLSVIKSNDLGILYPYGGSYLSRYAIVLRASPAAPSMSSYPIDFSSVHAFATRVKRRPFEERPLIAPSDEAMRVLEVYNDHFPLIVNFLRDTKATFVNGGKLTSLGVKQVLLYTLLEGTLSQFSKAYASVKSKTNMFNNPFRGTQCERDESSCRIVVRAWLDQDGRTTGPVSRADQVAAIVMLKEMGMVEGSAPPSTDIFTAIANFLRSQSNPTIVHADNMAQTVQRLQTELANNNIEHIVDPLPADKRPPLLKTTN